MKSVFSVDDLTDSLWPSPASTPIQSRMTKSQSEWSFQRLLEEISVSSGSTFSSSSATDNVIGLSSPQLQSELSVSRPEEAAASDIANVVDTQKPQVNAEIGPSHYQAILKSKLHLACAAVALRVAVNVKAEDSSASCDNQKQPSSIGSQTQGPVATQIPSVSTVPSLDTHIKPDIQIRQATSVSSRDYSDDEEFEGETETTENADSEDLKRIRRKLSNRESARRSRRRKQEQMSELDAQVGQLRAEHTTLLNRLRDIKHKYDTAAVDNRILKADIETLRTKVKMAEDTVKRVTEMHPLLLGRPKSISFNSTPTDSSQTNHTLNPADSTITGMIPNQRIENNFANSSVVPLNMNPDSNIGLKNSTKAPLPQNIALSNRLLEQQVKPLVRTNCNPYETPALEWCSKKDKPQD